MAKSIKIRVWDQDEQKFVEGFDFLGFDVNGNIVNIHIFVEGDGLKNYIIQQFTGLKDKNGFDIYEGDKLFVDEAIWIVSFRLGAFQIQQENDPEGYFGLLYEYNSDALICGNIFENK